MGKLNYPPNFHLTDKYMAIEHKTPHLRAVGGALRGGEGGGGGVGSSSGGTSVMRIREEVLELH